jgi:hypothetical protein
MKTASKNFLPYCATTYPFTREFFTSQRGTFTVGAGKLSAHSPIGYLVEVTGEVLAGLEYDEVCRDLALRGRTTEAWEQSRHHRAICQHPRGERHTGKLTKAGRRFP